MPPSYQYMIDNVVMIMTGVMKGEELDREELLARCHPLGLLDLIPALTVSRSIAELYSTVLIDTPLGPYFEGFQSNSTELDEMNVELIRLCLWKAYLEDFYKWCTTCTDGVTAETMGEILAFEADRRTMNIAINAVGTGLTKDLRLSLFPAFGNLYQAGIHERLAYSDDLSHLRQLIDTTIPSYRPFLDAAINASNPSPVPSSGTGLAQQQSFETLVAEREVDLCKESFMRQFCLTPFYAFCRLREQECRNIVWIAECIAQKQKDNIHNYIPIF